jgi:phage tail tape-measure protein
LSINTEISFTQVGNMIGAYLGTAVGDSYGEQWNDSKDDFKKLDDGVVELLAA